MLNSLHSKVDEKLYGLKGVLEFFLTSMLRLITCNMAMKCLIWKGLQWIGVRLKNCKMNFA